MNKNTKSGGIGRRVQAQYFLGKSFRETHSRNWVISETLNQQERPLEPR